MITLKKQIFLFSFLFLFNCGTSLKPEKQDVAKVILSDSNSFFYLDVQHYPRDKKGLPVGVFDSGTGGLAVLDNIINIDAYENKSHNPLPAGDGLKDFQKEYFIYLGDQANMPYGDYSRENNITLLKEHILKDMQFLLGNKYYLSGDAKYFQTDKKPVKAIVIACNTATAYGKKDIEDFIGKAGLKIKVIGVIDAAARAATRLFENESATVAVMATAGTVTSGGYVAALKAQMQTKPSSEIAIYQQAGIGLAGAIDGSVEYIAPDAVKPRDGYKGPSEKHPDAPIDMSILNRYGFDWENHKMLFAGDSENPENIQINSVENYISYHLVSLLEKIRTNHEKKPLKAIILGCTHYPFYRDIFEKKLKWLYNYQESGKYIYRPFMARRIELVDPAKNTAKELYEYLRKSDLFTNNDLSESEFYISVPNKLNKGVQLDSAGNFTYEYKYGRKAGDIQQYVKRVPFSKKSISPDIVYRLSEKVPETFRLISTFDRTNPKTSSLKVSDRF